MGNEKTLKKKLLPSHEDLQKIKEVVGEEEEEEEEEEVIVLRDFDEGGFRTTMRMVVEENRKLWVVAAPAILARFSTFGVMVVTQAFIGHIDSTELAGFALVFTVVVRFVNGILLGMASALETLCGQAYGAKQKHMLGVYLQRSWVVLLACAFLLLPLFLFTSPLLRLLGQDPAISAAAGGVALRSLPVMFSFVFYFTFQMYLQSQSRNFLIAALAAASFVLHVLISWIVVGEFSWGIEGAMAAMNLTMWVPVVGLFAFVCCGACPDTWTGFSWNAFTDLCPVIKLSLSSGVMVCLELWYNSVLVLLTGNMEEAEIAIDALSICLNITGWELMISLGFLAAAGVRVANELGAGSAAAAKLSIVVAVTTSLVIGSALFVFFFFFRGRIAYIFTDNPKVVDAVAELSPLLAFCILLNSIQPVLSGVAVGAGWQGLVAYVNLASYYLIGIPVGVLLGYGMGLQVKGVWIGMLMGTAVQTFVLMIITWRTDWIKQVRLAQERVNKWVVPAIAVEEQGLN